MLEPGQLLCDRYQLSQLLGEAPGRQTWLATDQTAATPEPVVVKLLAFGDTMQWVDLKLFEREAQVLQQLRHAYMPLTSPSKKYKTRGADICAPGGLKRY
jgi:hypothetical protein